MKKFYITICFFFMISSVLFSQEEIINLNNKELGIHKRPIVNFPHALHEKNIKCQRCHHEYDAFGTNIAGEDGRKCSECHKISKSKSNNVPLKRAFHLQCKTCHIKMKKEGKYNPPVSCGQCHVR
ncbi:MAG: cytochrome c3 family protein [Desulfobacterales bacterium]|nr:cytochrome c3 family protein [Desulfobacterales bacterium]